VEFRRETKMAGWKTSERRIIGSEGLRMFFDAPPGVNSKEKLGWWY